MDENNNVILDATEPKKKFHAFKYWADVIKWCINLVGIIVDSVKENQFPKKDDYTN
jgi:hypothetical protein